MGKMNENNYIIGFGSKRSPKRWLETTSTDDITSDGDGTLEIKTPRSAIGTPRKQWATRISVAVSGILVLGTFFLLYSNSTYYFVIDHHYFWFFPPLEQIVAAQTRVL